MMRPGYCCAILIVAVTMVSVADCALAGPMQTLLLGDVYDQHLTALAARGTLALWPEDWAVSTVTVPAAHESNSAGGMQSYGAHGSGERAPGSRAAGTSGTLYHEAALQDSLEVHMASLDMLAHDAMLPAPEVAPGDSRGGLTSARGSIFGSRVGAPHHAGADHAPPGDAVSQAPRRVTVAKPNSAILLLGGLIACGFACWRRRGAGTPG